MGDAWANSLRGGNVPRTAQERGWRHNATPSRYTPPPQVRAGMAPPPEEPPAAGPRPTTGHWIGNKPVLPEHIPDNATPQQRAALSDYLGKSHMNMQHPDMATVQARATATRKWNPVEEHILDETQKALGDVGTPHFALSQQMLHTQRHVLAERAKDRNPAERQQDIDHANTVGTRQGEGPAYAEMSEMLFKGKAGPMSKEQSALGVPAVIMAQGVVGKRGPGARMDATRTDAAGQPTHSTTSAHGVVLANDPGTKIREELGLAVMMGTSGSASDVVRSHEHNIAELQKKIPGTNVMHAKDHPDTVTDLAHHWLRRGEPKDNTQRKISAFQGSQNTAKISTPPASATQTHTYPEVRAGVDLTIHSLSKPVATPAEIHQQLRGSTNVAAEKMAALLPAITAAWRP